MSLSFDELIVQGKMAVQQTDYDQAIDYFSIALTHQATAALAYQLRAQAYQAQNKDEEAYTDYTHAIEYCAENHRHYQARAELGKKLSKETVTTDKALRLVYLALSEIDFDQFANARQRLDEASQLLPDLAAVICGYVILGARSKRHELLQIYRPKLPKLAESDALAYTARAYLEYNNQEFAQMLDNVELALEKDPYFARAHVLKGILFQLTGKMEDALQAVTRAIDIYPEFGLAYDIRAGFYQQMKRKDEAIRDGDTLLELNKENHVYWHRRAVLRLAMRNLQGAVADCEEALQRQGDYSPALATRGMSLAQQSIQDNGTHAIKDLTQAIELATNVAENYYHRAEVYAQMGQKQKAIADYERFIVLHRSQQAETGYITRNLMRLDVAHIEEKVQQIIEQLRSTSEPITPEPQLSQTPVITPRVEDYLTQGEAYMKDGKYEFAEEAFAHALEVDPTSALAYANLAVINWMQDNFETAYLCVKEALALQPDLPLHHLRARLLSSQADLYSEAIDAYTKLIADEPDVAIYYMERGSLYLENSKYAESLADLSQALELNHLLEDAYFMRGTVYGKLHDYAEAMADMQQVLEINPTRGEAYFFIGYILLQLGEKGRCVQSVEKALELEPYHPNADIWRQRLSVWRK